MIMKYSALEMAEIIVTSSYKNVECKLDISNKNQPTIFCNYPWKLIIPNDPIEQWYLTLDQKKITNKHRTRSGAFSTILIKPFPKN